MARSTFRIAAIYDTETCNKLFPDGNWYAWPLLYILNDVRMCDLYNYEPGCPGEHLHFWRDIGPVLEYVDSLVEDGITRQYTPIICAYNLMFDLQPIMYELAQRYQMEVNAQSATNVYTLDLMREGKRVLRFWDTYHLELRGLKAMGEACGAAKLTGDWDYSLTRTPATPLTDEELGYAARDVQVIPAYLRYLLEAYEWLEPYDLGMRVITKTSLVRQMARKKLGSLRVKRNMTLLKAFECLCAREQAPDFTSYATRLACFRGGLTFTAALTASQVVEHVLSLDETSAHHAFINGRRVPIEFHELEPDIITFWLEDVKRYNTYDVLHRYAYPFQRWFHACVRLKGMRLREGSAFDAWGIGLLAEAKFNRHVPATGTSYDNMRSIEAMEYVRANGFVDSAYNPTYAYGKLMSCDECHVWLSELEWWCVCQVYDFDSYEGVCGEGTIKSIWAPDYVTLQSSTLYRAKDDAKRIASRYREGEPYTEDIPESVAPGIAQGLREGRLTAGFVRSWYQSAIKGAFNGIYGTQAQNVLKSEYIVREDGELVVDRARRTTPATYDERLAEVKHPMVLYTYGLRIVGGSRMQLVIAMMLLYETFGGAVIVTGGDTDSLKVACMEGITADMLISALEPLHKAITDAIALCQVRTREKFPDLVSDLTGVGCFELEPATRESDAYALHMEAWNKARISIDADGRPHVTCAGLPQPDGAYTICDWLEEMHAAGYDYRDLMPLAIGYNVTITNEISHTLERTRPRYVDTIDMDVTDYLGVTSRVHTYQSIALYDSSRRLGDLMKYTNQRNVDYQRDEYGRILSTGEKVVSVDYDYPLMLALCGRTWGIGVYRFVCSHFTRPTLYRQTIEGMEAMQP